MRTRRGVSLCSLAPPRTDLNLAWNQPKYARRRRPPRGTPRHARDPLRERASSWPIVRKIAANILPSSFLPFLVSFTFRSMLDVRASSSTVSGKGTPNRGREIGLKNFHAGGAPITKLLSRCRVLLVVQRKITVSLNYKLRRPRLEEKRTKRNHFLRINWMADGGTWPSYVRRRIYFRPISRSTLWFSRALGFE